MPAPEQGSILKVDQQKFPVLVVSNREFNRSGSVIVSPILKNASPSPLHIPITTGSTEGFVLCEQVKYLDLTKRNYTIVGAVDYYSIMDISDAVISMVEYLN